MHSLNEHQTQGRFDRRVDLRQLEVGRRVQDTKHLMDFDQHMKKTPTRGYDVFIRNNYSDNLEGETPFKKRKVLDTTWNGLSGHEKAVDSAQADEENASYKDNVEGENFPEFLQRQGREVTRRLQKRRASTMSDRFRVVQKSIQEIIHSSVFNAGLQLHDYSTGIKKELMRIDLTRDEVRSKLTAVLHYDHEVVQNTTDK